MSFSFIAKTENIYGYLLPYMFHLIVNSNNYISSV